MNTSIVTDPLLTSGFLSVMDEGELMVDDSDEIEPMVPYDSDQEK